MHRATRTSALTILAVLGLATASWAGPSHVALSGPTIDRVIVKARRWLHPDDKLKVIMLGTPGGQARFVIAGAILPVPMDEVASGRYVARYVIPRGLVVRRGVVVVYLRENGQRVERRADRTVNIGPAEGRRSEFRVSPRREQTISNRRPTVTLVAPRTIRPETVQFYLDGINFSRHAIISGRKLRWTPDYRLSRGTHRAQFDARSPDGRHLFYTWSFSVGPRRANRALRLLPADGRSDVSLRPRIGALFAQTVEPDRTRLFIDHRDFTGEAHSTSQGITWTPGYDLSPGRHTARIEAYDQQGQRIQRSWSFDVAAPAQTNASSPAPNSQLSISNLRSGMALTPVFDVQGTSSPGARINVLVQYKSPGLLGSVTGAEDQFGAAATADSHGHFDVQVDASRVPSGQQMTLTVSDSAGGQVMLRVRRR